MNRTIPVFLLGASFWLLSAASVAAIQPEYAQKNHPSYWGDDCYKLEINDDIKTYTVTDVDATKVIVKGGPDRTVYKEGPFTDLTAPINPKNNKHYGISHVIICVDGQQDEDNGNIDGDTDKDDEKDKEQEHPAAKETEVLGETKEGKPETLPATGAPILVNALMGGLISTSSGYLHLMSRRRVKQAKRIEEIAL